MNIITSNIVRNHYRTILIEEKYNNNNNNLTEKIFS